MTRHFFALPSTIAPLLLCVLAAASTASAQQPVTSRQDPQALRQDPQALRQAVHAFLQTQTVGLPGKASVAVGAVDGRLILPACAALQPYLPRGARAWGKTTVGVRCSEPSPWNIFVSATVRVQGEYLVAAMPLAQGQTVAVEQLAKVSGDLTALPPGIITDESQAVGRTLSISLRAGTPLRQDTLRAQQAIRQGQTVRVETGGPGFKVSAEARALNNASEGQITQARTPAGQVVSGIARMGGVLEVTF